jgi:hypothetical protein
MRVQVGDVRLFVEVAGLEFVPDVDSMRQRPTVVVLHGGPGMDSAGPKARFGFLEGVAQVATSITAAMVAATVATRQAGRWRSGATT